MSQPVPDPARNAVALLAQAKRAWAGGGEMVRVILAGTSQLDSWLIQNRIVPTLQQQAAKVLHLTLSAADQERRSVSLLPMPDGSAFACATTGFWSALEGHEALQEIQHIGFRYAPSDRWRGGFEAVVEHPDRAATPMSPADVAALWEAVTGCRPLGFAVGVVDQLQAFGLDVIDKVFNTQGRLGL